MVVFKFYSHFGVLMLLEAKDVDYRVSSAGRSVVNFAKKFLILHAFGFDVDELTLNVFEDDKGHKHFYSQCPTLQKSSSTGVSLNALSFYEEVAASEVISFTNPNFIEGSLDVVKGLHERVLKDGVVSIYCSCYGMQAFRDVNGNLSSAWRFYPESLTNFLLYDTNKIVNFSHFMAASEALDSFEYAVVALSETFGKKPNSLAEEVIVTQKKRLGAAHNYYLNNLPLVIKELKRLSEGDVLFNILESASLTKMFVVPFSEFQFTTKRDGTIASFKRHFINCIGKLFLCSEEDNFLFAPEVFIKLWVSILKNEMGLKVPLETVSVSNMVEFKETLTSLCPPLSIFEDDFNYVAADPLSFNVDKFKEVVSSAILLTDSK